MRSIMIRGEVQIQDNVAALSFYPLVSNSVGPRTVGWLSLLSYLGYQSWL